jgi:hypothetical protein
VIATLTSDATGLSQDAKAPALSAISSLINMTLNAEASLSEGTVSTLFTSIDNLVAAGESSVLPLKQTMNAWTGDVHALSEYRISVAWQLRLDPWSFSCLSSGVLSDSESEAGRLKALITGLADVIGTDRLVGEEAAIYTTDNLSLTSQVSKQKDCTYATKVFVNRLTFGHDGSITSVHMSRIPGGLGG